MRSLTHRKHENRIMNLINRDLGHYKIGELLGTGGMGEVYLAQDTSLGRRVAIKFLSEKFSENASRLNRFVQEAKAASALNHPNIITIYEIGEFENRHFIVTEYIEGETVHARLAKAPFEIAFAVEVAIQVGSALEAAHKAGIIHRDIKPENVMIRPDGFVKILDFGIAKLTENSSVDTQPGTQNPFATQPGMVIGTPQYMSPEQSRGLRVDERTDIWSLGVVLYQMLTGNLPFRGETVTDVLVAILEKPMPPLENFMRDVPAELEKIVSKTLQKQSDNRYQSVPALGTDLRNLKRRLEFESDQEKNHPSDMAQTIVMEVPAVSSATAPHFSTSAIINKDKLLLTEFNNMTGDAVFDGTLKTALAVSLEQSPFLDIFPDTQVRAVLRLMEHSADDVVTAELGREICLRKGLKAYISGTISNLGSNYVLTLEAINARTGDTIGRQLEQAESKEQVLKSLGKAASGLRKKLGESLSSIEQFDAHFEYTTSSLEALKIYSLGIAQQRRGKWLEAVSFYNQAIELDPDFSSAYVAASSAYSNTNQHKQAAEYAARAFELKDRVSELEKLRISHFYYAYVTGDLDKRIETLEIMKRIYPRVITTLNNLSDCYMQLGRFEEAINATRKSLRENPKSAVSYDNLAVSLLSLNQFDEAKEVCGNAFELGLENIFFHICLYQIALVEGDAAAMKSHLDWMQGQPDEYMAFELRARTAAFQGRRTESKDLSRRAVDLANFSRVPGLAGLYTAEQVLQTAVFANQPEDELLREDLLTLANKALEFEANPIVYPRTVLALIFGGLTDEAEKLLLEIIENNPHNTRIHNIWRPCIVAALALEKGRAGDAIKELEIIQRYEPAAEFYPQYIRGRAFLKLDRNEEAASQFRDILNHRGQAPVSLLYPLAQLGLARAQRSGAEYEKFFEIWKDADEDIPVLMQAKAEFAELGSVGERE